METKVKPLGDRILIKNVQIQNVSSSGLILTSDKKQLPQIAQVVAVSDSIKNGQIKDCDYTIEEGQRIIYSKYAGTDITIGGQDYVIIRLQDVLAVSFL